MGVRDLFPTLRKLVPHSIVPLESLSHLPSGKKSKFAIDGNLLTTKFHFSPVPTDDNRHVKGWYGLLRELEKKGIEAVVVFDGQGRKVEKERERTRRREARELQRARGEAEGIRLGRLRELRDVWQSETLVETREESSFRGAEGVEQVIDETRDKVRTLWELYDEYEKDRANPVYSKNQELITKEEGVFYESALNRAGTTRTRGQGSTERQETKSKIPPLGTEMVETPTARLDESQVSKGVAQSPVPLITPSPDLPVSPSPYIDNELPLGGTRPTEHSSPGATSTEEPSLPILSTPSRLISVPPSMNPLPPPTPLNPEPSLDVPPFEPPLIDFDFDSLIHKSSQLSKSHLSRSVSVPPHVFDDVKDLISSMGYPILTPSPSNPHEAESICSLLYHHHSLTSITHVVSEDTDVLVYSAPLLRRISTIEGERKKKGFEMSVTDPGVVREGLGLGEREFVDWCLLCGTDFTDRIPLLGPSKALALIRQFGSIEAIFEEEGESNTNKKLKSKYFPPSLPPRATLIFNDDDEDNDVLGSQLKLDPFEDFMKRIQDARKIFCQRPRLGQVLRESETINLFNEGREKEQDRQTLYYPFSDQGEEEEKERGDETEVKGEWFEKKRERTGELERLKRRFGITSRGGRERGSATTWDEGGGDIGIMFAREEEEELEADSQEDNYDVEGSWHAEDETSRDRDEQVAEVWLREQERYDYPVDVA